MASERNPRLAVTVAPGYESVKHVEEIVAHMIGQGFDIVTTDRKHDAIVRAAVAKAVEPKGFAADCDLEPELPLKVIDQRAKGKTARRCQSKDLLGSADQALFFLAHWPADPDADRPHPVIREWPEGAWMMGYQLETLEHPYAAIDETGEPMVWIGEDSVYAYQVTKQRRPGYAGKRHPGVAANRADDGRLGTPDKPGRNEPCFCGATDDDGQPVKYKRCHLPLEQEAAQLFRDIAAMDPAEREALLVEVKASELDEAGAVLAEPVERPIIYGPNGRPL